MDTISLKSKVNNQATEKKCSCPKIYYSFRADSNFKTNTYCSKGEIVTDDILSKGKYTGKRKTLSITYKDEDIGKEIKQNMLIKTIPNTQLVIFIGLD